MPPNNIRSGTHHKTWSVKSFSHIFSNWLAVYNSVAFIVSIYIVAHIVYEYVYHQDRLSDLYSQDGSAIRYPFMFLELSLAVECIHLWFGIQNFGEHVLFNWAINLCVLFFVLGLIP